jgi:hypothetical protein
VKNGTLFAREGSPAPGVGFNLTGIGLTGAPVRVDNAGRVLWYGRWDDPDVDRDTGLFLDEELLVQEGVTTVGGFVVDEIIDGQDTFALSDNGSWAIFEGRLSDGTNGAFRIDLSGPMVSSPATRPVATALRASPNPFRAAVRLEYALSREATVLLEAFDISGRLVATLDDGARGAGDHGTLWRGVDASGRAVSPGVYFLRLRVGDQLSRAKLVKVH